MLHASQRYGISQQAKFIRLICELMCTYFVRYFVWCYFSPLSPVPNISDHIMLCSDRYEVFIIRWERHTGYAEFVSSELADLQPRADLVDSHLRGMTALKQNYNSVNNGLFRCIYQRYCHVISWVIPTAWRDLRNLSFLFLIAFKGIAGTSKNMALKLFGLEKSWYDNTFPNWVICTFSVSLPAHKRVTSYFIS